MTHKDHVLALLPYAFLAACPLLHMFMQGGTVTGGINSKLTKGSSIDFRSR